MRGIGFRILIAVLVLTTLGVPGSWAIYRLADVQDVQEQIDAVRDRLEQIRTLVDASRNEQALRLLEDGARNLIRAEQNLEQGNELQARNYVRRALELINAAARESSRNRGVSQDQAERELIRLREVLRAAEDLVEQVDSTQAQTLLQRAQEEAEKARQLFEQRNYLRSIDRVRRATSLATQARKVGASEAAQNPSDGVDFPAILDDLDELIQQARDHLGEAPTAMDAGQILGKAEELRQRAEASFNQGQLGRALELARRARELLRWIVQISGQMPVDSSMNQVERVRRELERARALLEEARQSLSNVDDSALASGLDQVQAWVAQAEGLIDQGHFQLAFRVLQQAIDLALHLIFQGQNITTNPFADVAEIARSEFARLVNEVLPDALEQVQEHPTLRAVYFLELAQAAAERARTFLDQEQFERALQEVNTANTLAREAVEESLKHPSM